ncbi:MAG: hypothetical protein HYY08_02665 [Firmicutes bacterium]|nr:hypothetical protein [Bacillota bacterium]
MSGKSDVESQVTAEGETQAPVAAEVDSRSSSPEGMGDPGSTTSLFEGGGGAGSRPFFPDHVLREMFVALLIATSLVLLAVYAPAYGLLGKADPSEMPAVRMPPWYFLFLDRLREFLPSWAIAIGAVVLMGFMMVLPFIDRNRARSLRKRPLAAALGGLVLVGVMYVSLTAGTPGASGLVMAQMQSTHCSLCHSSAGKPRVVDTAGGQSCLKCHGGPVVSRSAFPDTAPMTLPCSNCHAPHTDDETEDCQTCHIVARSEGGHTVPGDKDCLTCHSMHT